VLGRRLMSLRQGLARYRAYVAAGTGTLLILLGIVLPWLGVPFEHERSAWALRFVTPLLPNAGWLNFGAVELACLALVVVVLWRTRGRPSLAAFGGGALAVAVPLVFVALTTLSDMGLVQHLNAQAGELRSVTQLFGYKVPRTQPSSLLFIPLSGPWRTIASALRPGWFLAAGGGIVLMLANARAAWSAACKARVRAWLALAVTVVVAALVLFAKPVAANLVATQALTTAQSGDYATAIQQFATMNAIDHDMRLRAGVEVAWGSALRSLGDRNSPLALLADAGAQSAAGNTLGELDDLRRAATAAPDDPVITAAYRSSSLRAAEQSGTPGLLIPLVNSPIGDFASEHYVLARVYYGVSDFADALPQFTRVLDETSEPNTRSSAYTYRALCELHLGDKQQARTDLLRAVATDVEYNNSLARSLTTGLYRAINS
jgi:hypothetical protein